MPERRPEEKEKKGNLISSIKGPVTQAAQKYADTNKDCKPKMEVKEPVAHIYAGTNNIFRQKVKTKPIIASEAQQNCCENFGNKNLNNEKQHSRYEVQEAVEEEFANREAAAEEIQFETTDLPVETIAKTSDKKVAAPVEELTPDVKVAIAHCISLYWEDDLRNLSYFLNKGKELKFYNCHPTEDKE